MLKVNYIVMWSFILQGTIGKSKKKILKCHPFLKLILVSTSVNVNIYIYIYIYCSKWADMRYSIISEDLVNLQSCQEVFTFWEKKKVSSWPALSFSNFERSQALQGNHSLIGANTESRSWPTRSPFLALSPSAPEKNASTWVRKKSIISRYIN